MPPHGVTIEQIDGLVHLDCHTFLIECKNKETVDIEAIAKLQNQLLRWPNTTFGCVFAAERFSVPHRILLGSGMDIGACLMKKSFRGMLLDKCRHLCN